MIFGVSGFSGAGKTTAIKHLELLTGGRAFYLGAAVKQAAASGDQKDGGQAAQLMSRREMRETYGADCFAKPELEAVAKLVDNGGVALIDAILCEAERAVFRSIAEPRVLAVKADFDIRLARLIVRTEGKTTAASLVDRDAYERDTLRIEDVFASADLVLTNEGELHAFTAAIEVWLGSR